MAAGFAHIPVLLHEAVDGLAVREDGIYVDGTFGRGGHSREILRRLGPNGRLIGIDRDPEAVSVGRPLRLRTAASPSSTPASRKSLT